eukprot:TRINITY_DN24397_c0_g1_i1.p1 TRINITY_DN24397_c0_g1~~TRINITY_DN24397_c0_g1_i1.p1  ORF type:complete len:186 (+),score=60.07 TRINITY_DN24397_c0_g1_i1:238-795(+)
MAGAADRLLESYLSCIRTTLDAALCLRNFASQDVERHNKPEVECSEGKNIANPDADGHGGLVLPPIVIHKGGADKIQIEVAVNSVRVSIAVKQQDDIEKMIGRKFMQFMMRRAESFHVLRKVPVQGYDISLLITNFHMEKLVKVKVIEFVCEFISNIYSDIMEIKLALNSRGRSVADNYLSSFSQ